MTYDQTLESEILAAETRRRNARDMVEEQYHAGVKKGLKYALKWWREHQERRQQELKRHAEWCELQGNECDCGVNNG